MNNDIVMHSIGEDTYRYARYGLATLLDKEEFRKGTLHPASGCVHPMHLIAGLVLAALQVIPQLQGDATDQTPPDLPSYLFKERIVYLVSLLLRLSLLLSCDAQVQGNNMGMCSLQGMSLVPAVTELLLAELLYLQYDNPTRPVFMYINSAGVQARPCAANCESWQGSL